MNSPEPLNTDPRLEALTNARRMLASVLVGALIAAAFATMMHYRLGQRIGFLEGENAVLEGELERNSIVLEAMNELEAGRVAIGHRMAIVQELRRGQPEHRVCEQVVRELATAAAVGLEELRVRGRRVDVELVAESADRAGSYQRLCEEHPRIEGVGLGQRADGAPQRFVIGFHWLAEAK